MNQTYKAINLQYLEGCITAGYLYAPFGEILQEHLAVDNRIPKYAFNAKEFDEENGMYYYSARYYAPPTFISRDTMFEKYPSISPYTYCYNNPIKFIDPTGKDGFESEDGHYVWFDSQKGKSFTDENNITWTNVTSNKKQWNEAMTIRNAVIVSLVKLGFNQSEVMKDVKLFSGKSPLFTKAVKLNNAEKYTSTWSSEFNSETGKKDGLTSPEISNTGYALKFYSTKGKMNNVNAVGIVKSGMIEHIIEAGLEKIERKLFNEFADEDPIYDMHYENAKGFFKKVKKQ